MEQKAEQIRTEKSIFDLGCNRYLVPSQSQEDMYYEVCFLDSWSCTCAYFLKRHSDCKHIIVVQQLVLDVPPLEPVDFTIKMPEVRCTKKDCGSADCRFYENRPLKKGGTTTRYKCRKCGRRFTWRPGFLGRHYPDSVITGVVRDVVGGKSCGTAARDAKNNRDLCSKEHTLNSATAWRWLKHARDATAKIPRNVPISTGGKWAGDEHYFKYKDGRYEYGVMDLESGFVLARDTSPEKLHYDATELYRNAVEVAGTVPRVMTTDKLEGYIEAFGKIMRGRKRKGFSAPVHNNSAGIGKVKIHNNNFECYNGTVENRTKTARGFNSEDPPLLGAFWTYYNFLRPHMGRDKRTPAEVMGIKVEGPDEWATLIAFGTVCC